MTLNAKQDNHIMRLATVTLLIMRESNHNESASHVSSGFKDQKIQYEEMNANSFYYF